MINWDLFWAKVSIGKPDDCWEWKGYRSKKGYGAFRVGRTIIPAHRVAHISKEGIFPVDWVICHKCDNPSCCNPNHLFAGTVRDNAIDMARKKRGGSMWGKQKLSVENVIVIKSRLKRGERPAQISKDFPVSIYTICKIADNKIWKHVESSAS